MPTTKPTAPSPKYRKQLNELQTEILLLLYKFRFATPDLIIKYQGLQSRRYVNVRLKILMEQEYIGRIYDSSHRIKGKQAIYYLLPDGIKFLKTSSENLDPKGLNLLYYNRSASEGFVNHCLSLFGLYIKFDEQYGQSLEFFTRSEIANEKRFPRPLPDANLVLQHKQAVDSEFFLEYIEKELPYFTVRRRIRRYFTHYDEERDNTQGDYPIVLLVGEGSYLERQVQRMAARLIDRNDSDLKVYTTTTKALLGSKSRKTAVWSDVMEPEGLVSL